MIASITNYQNFKEIYHELRYIRRNNNWKYFILDRMTSRYENSWSKWDGFICENISDELFISTVLSLTGETHLHFKLADV